jgi:pyruvate/2-oxoglutarate dehydrogenase complex dihydrolipoamide acyltransferase (E2) component
VSEGADPEPDPSPVRRALDLFVFAPVGVALTVAEDLPALIVKGRQRFENDVRNARLVGKFVVTHGQRDVVGRVSRLLYGDTPAPPAETAAPAPTAAPAASASAPPASGSAKPAADPADATTVDAALAGYDTLSASQVVRRLESLGPDELRAVCRHEASHRNRRTILNRAQQLLEGAEPDRPVG